MSSLWDKGGFYFKSMDFRMKSFYAFFQAKKVSYGVAGLDPYI